MSASWRINITKDETLNDSDKIFTVPVNTEWDILWIYVTYASSATVGSRQLEIQLQDSGSSVIGQWQTGITQAENLTYNYLFGVGIPDLLFVRDVNYLTTPLMGASFLSAGQKIRVWDNNAIAAGTDDMTVKIEYGYHDI